MVDVFCEVLLDFVAERDSEVLFQKTHNHLKVRRERVSVAVRVYLLEFFCHLCAWYVY